MTAATLRLGTFGHIRGEKKGAGSIDVNYANVTREGAQWSVSPPKESIKVKQLVSPSFFFPLQTFDSVTTATMCRITAHVNTHTTKLYFTAETHEHQNSNKQELCEKRPIAPHTLQKLPPAQSQRSSKSLTCKLGEGRGLVSKCITVHKNRFLLDYWHQFHLCCFLQHQCSRRKTLSKLGLDLLP